MKSQHILAMTTDLQNHFLATHHTAITPFSKKGFSNSVDAKSSDEWARIGRTGLSRT